MRPPCELVVRQVLPAFRSLVAKELVEVHGLSETAAARKLGTTQAAISQYLSSKRGDKRIRQLESKPSVRSAAKEVARGIATSRLSPLDGMLLFCGLCVSLRRRDLICNMHRDLLAIPKGCDACPEVRADSAEYKRGSARTVR